MKWAKSPSLLPVLSAVLLFLAFPPVSFGLLALVALSPLAASLENVGFRVGFRRGFAFGFIFWALALLWLIAFVTSWTRSVWLGLIPWLVLSLALAIYSGVFGAVTGGLMGRSKVPSWLVFASAWTLVFEYCRSYVPLGGLPWTLLGTSPFNYPLLLQPAALGGVWLLGFIFAAFNFGLTPRRSSAYRIAAISPFVACLVYSTAFAPREWKSPDEKSIEVAVLQTGVFSARDLTREMALSQMETMVEMLSSLPARPRGIQRLAVLPESAVPFDPLAADKGGRNSMGWMAGKVREADHVLFGAHTGADAANIACLVDRTGAPVTHYAKVYLVPFGEYVPYRESIPLLSMYNLLSFDMKPGRGFIPLDAGGFRVGTPICFESLYPDVSRTMARRGANLLAILVNDDWYGTATRWQHAMAAPIRAVETRLPVVRVTTTGISMVCHPDGSYTAIASRRKSTSIWRVTLGGAKESFYVRTGDWIVWLSGLVLVLAVVLRTREAKPDAHSIGGMHGI